MSRIGLKPIPIPSGVEVKAAGTTVSVKGPLGLLDWSLAPGVTVAVDDGQLRVTRASNEPRVRAIHGLVRAELNNMVEGVTKGYEKSLEITGVGYKGQIKGKVISFNVGYTHPVEFVLPDGIEAKIDKQTYVTIKGIDKRKVGQVAANIRRIKPPDVYKQKGIRYVGEKLRKKEGKTGK